jgi:hypothetical protein
VLVAPLKSTSALLNGDHSNATSMTAPPEKSRLTKVLSKSPVNSTLQSSIGSSKRSVAIFFRLRKKIILRPTVPCVNPRSRSADVLLKVISIPSLPSTVLRLAPVTTSPETRVGWYERGRTGLFLPGRIGTTATAIARMKDVAGNCRMLIFDFATSVAVARRRGE